MPALPTCSAGAANPRAAQGRGGRRGRIHRRHARTSTHLGECPNNRGSSRRGQIQTQAPGADGPHRGAEGGAMEEPERRAEEKTHGMSPGDPQGHCGGDG